MFERLFDFFVDTLKAFFIPAVCTYHLLTADLFLNVSIEDAPFLEKAGNTLLIPLQFLFDGKVAFKNEEGSWQLIQRFGYADHYWLKTSVSLIALPPSFLLGCFVKGISFCSKETQKNYCSLKKGLEDRTIAPHAAIYQDLGIILQNENVDWLERPHYQRRPGDENHLEAMKECLSDITELLNQAQIPWWVDCGTCLGALRYGGVIPWDDDIDISTLLIDFENVRRVLQGLNREKYLVQDWSTRDIPNSFFKIYIRKTSQLVDIYFYEIDLEKRELQYIFSLDTNIFWSDGFKERERRFTIPTSFDTVFPLKKAMLDGVEVFVPHDTVKFLQRYYGENLNPARVYDEKTGRFEKDLSHPYWKMSYVH